MAKLIFISPYLKGGTNSARLANHVRYISTRDGVQTLNDGAKNLPPTKKQEEYIQKLTKKFSEAKLLPEYDAYVSAPSRYSASEFIEQTEEIYSFDLDERENFIGYIANRPGVRKLNEHGLWNADGQVPVIQTAMDEVSHHEGNVWRPVISLPREDAERLGYDHVEAWQNLIKSSLIDIAEGYKIKPDHLRWYAAMHMKEKHTLLKNGIGLVISVGESETVCDVYSSDVLGLIQNDPRYADVEDGLFHNMPQKHLEHKLLTASAKVDNKQVTLGPDNGSANAFVPLTVVNTKGFDLPKTGGYGNWMFPAIGLSLVAVAVVVIYFAFRDKKKETNK